MKFFFRLLLGLLFSCQAITAQDKLWEKDLKDQLYEVGWIQQTNDGTVIASGAKGLIGLDNVTGETKWFNKELKAINKNSFFNIEGLPLFYAEYSPILGKTRGLIINAVNGDIAFDTGDRDFKIRNYTLLKDQAMILFEVLKGKERNLLSFSLKTWKENWITSLGVSKSGFGVVKSIKGKIERLQPFIKFGPYSNKDQQLIIGLKEDIYSLDPSNGKIIWKWENDKKIKALVYSKINENLYIGIRKSKKLTVLNPSNGQDITPGKLKLRGTLLDIVPNNQNELVLVETEGFNIIDPKTNSFKWKKSFKIDYLEEVIPRDNNYIAIGKDEKESVAALVDTNGKKIWDSKIKGYAYYITPTDKGIMYISTERANILNFDDGKDLWKKDIKFKSIPAVTFDNDESKVILFENKKGYKFDLKSGDIQLFAEDIELKAVKKSTPLVAEYIKDSGYLLSTPQHISLLSKSGKIKYSDHYPPASSLGGLLEFAQLGLNVYGIDLDIKGSLQNIKDLKQLSAGSFRESNDQTDGTAQTDMVGGLYVGTGDNMTPIIEITKTRFFNSKKTKENMFIVTKQKNETSTKHFIFLIDKKSGKINKQIELFDKTPNYFIDEIDNVTFINEKNHLISAYKF